MNTKSTITLILAAAIFGGCAFEGDDATATDDAISAVDYAQTWGSPGFPLPPAMRIDPGDEVVSFPRACERQRDPETQRWAESIQGAAARCVPLAEADCKADGGVLLGYSINSYQRIPKTDTTPERWFAHVTSRCLFNVEP